MLIAHSRLEFGLIATIGLSIRHWAFGTPFQSILLLFSSATFIFAVEFPPSGVLVNITPHITQIVGVSNDVIVKAALPDGASE